MGRRTYSTTLVCAERPNGCTETSFFESSTQRERRESEAYYAKRPWRCTRHVKPDELLTPTNVAERTTVLTASKVETTIRSIYDTAPGPRYLDGLFWREEGQEGASSGFVYGPGFKAYAKDFPEGTRLVVTARIELPEAGEWPSPPVPPSAPAMVSRAGCSSTPTTADLSSPST